jgi:hypothetical protein
MLFTAANQRKQAGCGATTSTTTSKVLVPDGHSNSQSKSAGSE